MRILLSCLLALTVLSACDKKGVTHDLQDPHYIAIVNGHKIPIASAKAMLSAMNKGQVQHKISTVVQGIIENELIAQHALKNLDEKSLVPVNRVAFDFDVALEDQYISIMRSQYEEKMLSYISKHLPNGNIASTANKPFTMKRSELKPFTKLKSRGKIGFTEKQIATAKEVMLLSYQFPGESIKNITLYDIYRRQNIQGKDLLNKAEINFLKRNTYQRLGSLFVHYWLKHHSGLDDEELAAVKRFVHNKEIKQLYMVHQGLVSILHADPSEKYKAEVQAVSQKAIQEYYTKHKEDFKRIDRVRGRHIRTKSQEQSQLAHTELIAGNEFSNVAKKYSIAADKNKDPAGDTGWITRKDRDQMWLQTLLFTQEKGLFSRPFRSPQISSASEVYWDIVTVDEVEESYQAPDSEGVRYEVSQILAKKNIAKQFKSVREQLFSNSYIQLNGELLGLNQQEANNEN